MLRAEEVASDDSDSLSIPSSILAEVITVLGPSGLLRLA